MRVTDREPVGLEKYNKFFSDLVTSLQFNSITVPKSIEDNSDGELYQGSIGGKHEHPSYCLTSDSKFLVRGSKNRCIKIVSLNNQRIIDKIDNLNDSVVAVCVTPDKSVVAGACSDGSVAIWSMGNLKLLAELDTPSKAFVTILLSPASQPFLLGLCPQQSIMCVWSLANYKLERVVDLPKGILCAVADSEGRDLAVGCEDKVIRFLSLDEFEWRLVSKPFTGAITSLTYSEDRAYMIAGTADKKINILTGRDHKTVAYTFQHFGRVDAVSLSYNGKFLAAASNKLLLIFSFEDDDQEKLVEKLLEDKICNIHLASDSLTLICGLSNDNILVFDIETGRIIFQILGSSHTTPITAVFSSPDSKFAVSGTADGDIKLWSIEKFLNIASLEDKDPHINDVSTLCISPDCKYIACAPYKEYKTIKIWSVATKQVVKEIEIQEGVDDICFSYDSEYLICSATETDFWLWDLEKLEKVQISKKVKSRILCMAVSRRSQDKKYLVGSTEDKNIIVWQYPRFDVVATLAEEDCPSEYHLVTISFNNKYIATASDRYTVSVWSLRSFQLLKTLEGHTDSILSLSFSPDANYIFSCSRTDKVFIWSTFYSNTKLFVLQGETRTINCVAVTPDSRYILGGSDDASINVWRLDSNLPKSFIKSKLDIQYYAITPDSSILALVIESRIELWSLERLIKLEKIEDVYFDRVSTVVFSPNSHYMLIGSVEESAILIYSMKTFNIFGKIEGGDYGLNNICSLVCSPNSEFVIAANRYQTLFKFSIQDYSLHKTAAIKNDQIEAIENTVAISSDSRYVVAGYGRGFLVVFRFEDLSEKETIAAHTTPITHLIIKPNSQHVITCSENDKTIKVFSLKTFKQIDSIESTHNHPITSLSVSADGKYMVGLLEDRSARVWSLYSYQQIDKMEENDAGRICCLSPNAKYLVMQCRQSNKTVILPFMSEQFQTYPFILNLIKAYYLAETKEARMEILSSLIVIVTKHRRFYQVVLNPIFSIIALLLNEEETTSVILSQYLTPYRLFSHYEPLSVVIVSNRTESVKTYLNLLLSYKKKYGYYPYYDQDFIRLLLTKYPNLINSVEMKRFIIDNLFQLIGPKMGELKEAEFDTIEYPGEKFTPKDLRSKVNQIDEQVDSLFKTNPVNVQNYDCYVSLIPLDFRNGSRFSRLFFSNLNIFPQSEIETKLSKFIYFKFRMVYRFHLINTVLYWTYNLLLYLFMGLLLIDNLTTVSLFVLQIYFLVSEVKYLVSDGWAYFQRTGQVMVLCMHTYTFIASVLLIIPDYREQESIMINVLRLSRVVFVSLRGIWRMRIFKTSRFLVSMVYQVVLRIKSFFVMMFYFIFIFECIWRMLPSIASGQMVDDLSVADSLKSTFSIAFMSYSTDDYELKEWIVFVVAILTLNFILLNYLVSIICIFYEEVASSTLITDIDEVIKMINEEIGRAHV